MTGSYRDNLNYKVGVWYTERTVPIGTCMFRYGHSRILDQFMGSSFFCTSVIREMILVLIVGILEHVTSLTCLYFSVFIVTFIYHLN
jgi:hypothetical protein